MFLRIHKALVSAAFLTASLFCATAWADDCENLKNNMEWTAGMGQLQLEFNNKDYDAVIARGEDLSYLCARSPELNYFIGKAYAAKGSNDEALVYLGIAGDSIADFQSSPDLVRDIYYARYEIEHPNTGSGNLNAIKGDMNALQNENARIKQDNKTCQDNLAALKKDNSAIQDKLEALKKDSSACPQVETTCPQCPQTDSSAIPLAITGDTTVLKKTYSDLFWAGLGVGIGGVALTSVGGGLVGTVKKYTHEGIDASTGNHKYKIAPGYITGWTFIGAGLAATVTGFALATVYGIKLNHLNEDVSLNISPMGFDFSVKF